MRRPPAAATASPRATGRTVRLTVLGASAVRPNPGGACAGYLLESNGSHVLLDCGPGVVSRLLERLPLTALDGVLVSHGHPDHCLDLVMLRQALLFGPGARREAPLPLHVPPGLSRQLDQLGAAFLDDADSDPAADYWSKVIARRTFDPGATLDLGIVKVTFAPTRHYVPCWAMRLVDDAGRTLVYGADGGPSEPVSALARDADLLVLECTFASRIGHEADGGHLAPAEAGRVAAASGARRLLLTHMFASDDGEAMRAAAAAECAVPVELALEGSTWTI